jgi:hypothetical protein
MKDLIRQVGEHRPNLDQSLSGHYWLVAQNWATFYLQTHGDWTVPGQSFSGHQHLRQATNRARLLRHAGLRRQSMWRLRDRHIPEMRHPRSSTVRFSPIGEVDFLAVARSAHSKELAVHCDQDRIIGLCNGSD